ncbi:MAG: bifunctional hydroxymethylpyrimidine kinase/phosphomethylpyrimidine kinase, partial [Deltaproteobacteria bacterium]|nr:bifunctional hydroxymethylpyrimidine kinase/phosphomethylpyrimidine kinase [Deltaproteobacteria bacterium]
AFVLTGQKVTNVSEMKEAARRIFDLGPQAVLVKGGHLAGDCLDLLFDGRDFYEYFSARIDTTRTHGTGCTFSAALVTYLAQGKALPQAVDAAKKFITLAIKSAPDIGHGFGPTNHYAGLNNELSRMPVLQDLAAAARRLAEQHLAALVPEVSSNFGYALPAAIGLEDVAAFPGRIVKLHGRAVPVAPPEFGASRHVARIILTLMAADPARRAAMNVAFSEENVARCRSLGFSVAEFSRAEEPDDIRLKEGSTLEWGTGQAIKRAGYVPDVIFDRGGPGKEPMIRITGRHPDEVADKVLALAGK